MWYICIIHMWITIYLTIMGEAIKLYFQGVGWVNSGNAVGARHAVPVKISVASLGFMRTP